MSDQPEDPLKSAEELRLLYSISIEDIRYSKNRQWSITYYGLLTYAALIGFYGLIQGQFCDLFLSQKSFYLLLLITPGALIFLVCVWLIMDIHSKLIRYRDKLKAIDKTFETTPKKIAQSGPGNLEIGRLYWVFPGVFLALVGFGFLYLAWFIYGTDYNTSEILFRAALFIIVWVIIVYVRHKLRLRALDKEKSTERTSMKKVFVWTSFIANLLFIIGFAVHYFFGPPIRDVISIDKSTRKDEASNSVITDASIRTSGPYSIPGNIYAHSGSGNIVVTLPENQRDAYTIKQLDDNTAVLIPVKPSYAGKIIVSAASDSEVYFSGTLPIRGVPERGIPK